MSPCKSSCKINFTNFCTFTQWIFFNHAMNVFFPDFNVFLRVVENRACLFNKGLFTITTKITLVIEFYSIFYKVCRLAMRTIRNLFRLNYFLTRSFWLTEVKKFYLSVSDKFSKSCFKISNSFVIPDMIKYQHIIKT